MNLWPLVIFALGAILGLSAKKPFQAKVGLGFLLVGLAMMIYQIETKSGRANDNTAVGIADQYQVSESQVELQGITCDAATRYSCATWKAKLIVDGEVIGYVYFDESEYRIEDD